MLEEIQGYWNHRSQSYAQLNLDELGSEKKQKWQKVFLKYAPNGFENIHLLDIGCGPGIFSIIFSELGACVSALDYTPKMLERAKENAQKAGARVAFYQGDAQNLEFGDGVFDWVVSRNLTWNLKDPYRAYQEWYRVLKKGGRLLNFDANWYLHLFDPKHKERYEQDREKVAQAGILDHMTQSYPNAKKMEEIAKSLPLSKIHRPGWDIEALESIGFEILGFDKEFYQEVWDCDEKLMFASTPMFLIAAQK
ncbi:hypothetical protein BKH46_05800 [Helicobacter sp. 12S02634-8]|uniref:class I SAM-dependent methyltransferase n=1 Tax=Helicobacter sp. 12S02634-8 TaxID=1476199 RepID=UPI000BA61C97|nr:class I SAM-dependent methyltransferase [Helicobacter sp. 12S02634-8]PAF46949.1 hypothetical protein BKH46_05800 [Helicobacter sp. 12S02634-8]